jgi:uncharacterized protein YhaN
LHTLKLDPNLDLSTAKRVVETVLAVRQGWEALRQEEERSRILRRSITEWQTQVRTLCSELAPDLSTDADAAAAMRQLYERWQATTHAQQRRTDLQLQFEELTVEQRQHEVRRGELNVALDGWRRRAGVTDDSAFVQAAAAAARAHDLDAQIEQLQRALAEARGAQPAADFDAALETAERALIDAALADLRSELEQVEMDYGAANQAVGAAQADLARVDGSAAAAEVALAIESQRAALRAHVNDYAVLTLARVLLERQVRRYQERHQPELLADVSQLFARLTAGGYRRVYQRLDEQSTFIAVRADGVEVTPEAMSTGTREQLYLAIRIAYVQTYCRNFEPLPVVLDDVLVNCDAARAQATLEVLRDLASVTQVLFFTCHAHLVALAQTVDPTLVPVELQSTEDEDRALAAGLKSH